MGPDVVDPRGVPHAAGAGLKPCTMDGTAVPAGTGIVRIDRAGARSIVTRAFAMSPLRLLNPRNHGHAAWIYTATYGGGLVDGDAVRLTVDVGPGAAALLSTQASTKIYRSSAGTSADVDACVADEGLLVVAPDPVVCFAGASYRQTQRVELAATAALVLVDWLTSGRRGMGERWAFDNCVTRLTVRRQGRLLVHDALSLCAADGDLLARMRRFDVVCTIVIAGASLREHAARAVSHIAETPVVRRTDLLRAASPIGEHACVVRLAGTSVEQVAHAVRDHFSFVPALLGDDLWTRKW